MFNSHSANDFKAKLVDEFVSSYASNNDRAQALFNFLSDSRITYQSKREHLSKLADLQSFSAEVFVNYLKKGVVCNSPNLTYIPILMAFINRITFDNKAFHDISNTNVYLLISFFNMRSGILRNGFDSPCLSNYFNFLDISIRPIQPTQFTPLSPFFLRALLISDLQFVKNVDIHSRTQEFSKEILQSKINMIKKYYNGLQAARKVFNDDHDFEKLRVFIPTVLKSLTDIIPFLNNLINFCKGCLRIISIFKVHYSEVKRALQEIKDKYLPGKLLPCSPECFIKTLSKFNGQQAQNSLEQLKRNIINNDINTNHLVSIILAELISFLLDITNGKKAATIAMNSMDGFLSKYQESTEVSFKKYTEPIDSFLNFPEIKELQQLIKMFNYEIESSINFLNFYMYESIIKTTSSFFIGKPNLKIIDEISNQYLIIEELQQKKNDFLIKVNNLTVKENIEFPDDISEWNWSTCVPKNKQLINQKINRFMNMTKLLPLIGSEHKCIEPGCLSIASSICPKCSIFTYCNSHKKTCPHCSK